MPPILIREESHLTKKEIMTRVKRIIQNIPKSKYVPQVVREENIFDKHK